jgi:hypothetical protein
MAGILRALLSIARAIARDHGRRGKYLCNPRRAPRDDGR